MLYAVADIHGCAKTFKKLLELSRLSKQDTLYLLGDYIDRGPDSRGVLEYIIGLIEGGYDVRPLKGNHEALILNAYQKPEHEMAQWWLDGWGEGTITSFDASCLNGIPDRYWNFMNSLQRVIEIDDYIFVHGSLDPSKEDPVIETDPYTMLWGTTWHVDGIKGKTLVSGHVVCPLHVIYSSLPTNHILLDNGCYHSGSKHCGNLVMLNLATKELLLQPLIDEINDWRV